MNKIVVVTFPDGETCEVPYDISLTDEANVANWKNGWRTGIRCPSCGVLGSELKGIMARVETRP